MAVVHRISMAASIAVVALVSVLAANAQMAPSKSAPPAPFAPVEQWKAAVLAGDASKLQALYSTNPAARVVMQTGEAGAETDVAFWIGLKARRMKINLAQSTLQQPGLQQVGFEVEVVTGAQGKAQTSYVIDGQLWQKQGDQWRIVATQRSPLSKLQQPLDTSKNIYVPGLNAHTELARRIEAGGATA